MSRQYVKAIVIVAARMERNMTQRELSERTGIRQSNISRIENGNCSPTVATLQQIADGVGKTLHIEFG
jgi:transcriptional regulator with XRE-family HTH domain